MIHLLIKRFIKDYKDITNKKVRKSYGVLTGVVGILCNIFLFVLKLSVGLYIKSVSAISDAFNNLSDSGTSLINILSAKYSNMPPDEEHPNGHGRIEYVASLTVAFIIFAVGMQLLRNSIEKILNPTEVMFSITGSVLLALSVITKIWMYSYNKFVSVKINSSINKATAIDSLNDAVATTAVILGTIVGPYVNFPVDGIIGLVISLMIVYSAFKMAKEAADLLIGTSANPELKDNICAIVLSGNSISGTHDLVIHDYGPGQVIATIHAEVCTNSDIVQIHSEIDRIEKKILEELGVNMVIHPDPVVRSAE